MADVQPAAATHQATVEAEFERLIQRVLSYRPKADIALLRRAFEFAADVHRTQLRQSGEPYVLHPLMACHILADIEADEVALAACMLHDTVEDCAQDEEREIKALKRRVEDLQQDGKLGQVEQLRREIAALEHVVEKLKDEVGQHLLDEFGEVVGDLVDGVTRLSEVRFYEERGQRHPMASDDEPDATHTEEVRRRLQAENLRRMVVAAAKDVRVLIIKLADRLHNMQTLYAKRRPKQIKIARETEVIYAKLADRLGIWRIKWEMEDQALRYLHPEAYFEIERRVARTRDERQAEIDAVVGRIRERLDAAGIPNDVYGRPKHIYSIYHKMQRQGIDFDAIYDLEAIRVIVDTIPHCYECLGTVHNLWPHQSEHFADYISNPKGNGYRSIHTKVIVPGHGPMEIQIRTIEMHRDAEYGVAAHWRYKEDGVIDESFARRLSMMRTLFETARATKPAALPDGENERPDEGDDFLREVEASLWEEEVFVFTPKGECIDLPKGATVVDFAYRIHTQVGHTCIGARVNRRIVPLDYVLHNGDQVEILRQQGTGPSRDWLKFVITRQARNRVRQYFRQTERENLIDSGQRALEVEAVKQRVDLKEIYRRDQALPPAHRRRSTDQPVEDLLTRVARRRGLSTGDDMLTAVGEGVMSAEAVLHQLEQELTDAYAAAGLVVETEPDSIGPAEVETRTDAAVTLQGISNLMFRRSKCCLPIPGDPILGYTTRGSGIAIHRADCPNILHLREREPDRVVELDWDQTEHMLYDVPLEIRANDRMGLLRDLAGLMSEIGINILKANTISPPLNSSNTEHLATIRLNLELLDRSQLEDLLRRLPTLGVVKVTIRGQVYHDAEKGTRVSRRPGGAALAAEADDET